MSQHTSRRQFLRDLGLSAAAMPYLLNLPSLGFANSVARKQRLVVMFSPNGVNMSSFWPDEAGTDFQFKESLAPLEPFKARTLVAKGICDKVKGDGDGHMRGIGCLLTGCELFPGNIQGGSHTPAGWASGLSVDQEIRNFLQSKEETKTRFGSLEFGVMVPDKADTWTRMVYSGPNKPVAPISSPHQMFSKLYGRLKDQSNLHSVLDELQTDLSKLRAKLSKADRALLDEHTAFVRSMEQELQASAKLVDHVVPKLDPVPVIENDRMPEISKIQIDLLVDSFASDFARVATLQFTNSVGQARMRWLGINEGHHELSHEPNSRTDVQEKLTKINRWFCEQMAYLAKRLSETPEPGTNGSLLDNTTIVWTNELGEGNSHTMNNIPFVMVGNGLDFTMGRSLQFKDVPHNRLLMSFAHAFGHRVERVGNPDFCGDGPLSQLI